MPRYWRMRNRRWRIPIFRLSLTVSTSQSWSQTSSLWTQSIWRSSDHSIQLAWARSRSARVRRSNSGLQDPAGLLTLTTWWPRFRSKTMSTASTESQCRIGFPRTLRWTQARTGPCTWRILTENNSTTSIVWQLSTRKSLEKIHLILLSSLTHYSGESRSSGTQLPSPTLPPHAPD